MQETIEIVGEVALAKFIAQLVREGVTFTVVSADPSCGAYLVKLTGGF